MAKRRPIEVFSISFLDTLSCGFGAILLLFLLSIGSGRGGAGGGPGEAELRDMRARLESLGEANAELARRLEAATADAGREAAAKALRSEIQSLEERLAQLEKEYASRESALSAGAQEAARAERLLEAFPVETPTPIGLPADVSHAAFVIDTSGSMRNQLTKRLHPAVTDQIRELLDALPEVKRMQFLDTSGNYLFGGRSGYWLPDTGGLRRQALNRIAAHPVLSVSDPERGIETAIRDLKSGLGEGERMGIYVLGDDFRGSTESFLADLDRLNPENRPGGQRPVSISAVGFPTLSNPFRIGAPQGNARFANIMRRIAEAHDGVLILRPGL